MAPSRSFALPFRRVLLLSSTLPFWGKKNLFLLSISTQVGTLTLPCLSIEEYTLNFLLFHSGARPYFSIPSHSGKHPISPKHSPSPPPEDTLSLPYVFPFKNSEDTFTFLCSSIQEEPYFSNTFPLTRDPTSTKLKMAP